MRPCVPWHQMLPSPGDPQDLSHTDSSHTRPRGLEESGPHLEASTCSSLPKPTTCVRPRPESVRECQSPSPTLWRCSCRWFLVQPRSQKHRTWSRASPLPLSAYLLILKPSNNSIHSSVEQGQPRSFECKARLCLVGEGSKVQC